MRGWLLISISIFHGLSTLSHAADATPTVGEEKAMAEIKKLGGTAEIDPELPSEARVKATFPAMTDLQLAGLKKIEAVGALTTGDVRRATDRGLGSLAALPHLRKLTLSQSAATNATAAVLDDCKELRLLYLGNARLGDAGLLAFQKLTKLEVLDVSNNPAITDKGLAHLAQMSRLEQLYIGGTAITDKGLEELRPLEGLTRLHVTNTMITSPAAEAFERSMPNLRQVRR